MTFIIPIEKEFQIWSPESRMSFVGESCEMEFAVAWGDRKTLCCSFGIRPVTGKFPSSFYKYLYSTLPESDQTTCGRTFRVATRRDGPYKLSSRKRAYRTAQLYFIGILKCHPNDTAPDRTVAGQECDDLIPDTPNDRRPVQLIVDGGRSILGPVINQLRGIQTRLKSVKEINT